MEILVPDLGDFTDVEVIELLASPGDILAAEAPLITIETDKAAMEVPSPVAGKLVELKVAMGDRVSTGDVIGVIEPAEEAVAAGGDDAASEVVTAQASAEPAETSPTPTPAEPAPQDVAVPDLGDFADVEVIEVLVAVGDTVTVDQGLFTVETEKAAMDVPTSVAGVVQELRVKQGDTVNAGDVVAVVEGVPAAAVSQAAPAAPTSDAKPAAAAAPPKPPAAPRKAQLPPIDETSFGKAHASPSVRKLARELGVNLGSVQGNGHKHRITAEDVKSYVKQIMLSGGVAAGPALPEVPDVDHAAFGAVESVKLTRIQRISGPRLHASWVNLPHVTQNDNADITELEAKRQALKAEAAEQGVKLTPLAFIMRACALVLEEFPVFRSSLAKDGKSLVMKQYTHLGFAADTPNGLVVPVIRDADKKSVLELAELLADLSGRARDGKLKANDMQGGVFTVSSLGGIGGTSFTPIINAPEVAILGVARSSLQPVYQNEEFVPRLMLPLCLSYDHRVIDGAMGARFITRLSAILGDVDLLLGKSA